LLVAVNGLVTLQEEKAKAIANAPKEFSKVFFILIAGYLVTYTEYSVYKLGCSNALDVAFFGRGHKR
jgi:hypothetical protein